MSSRTSSAGSQADEALEDGPRLMARLPKRARIALANEDVLAELRYSAKSSTDGPDEALTPPERAEVVDDSRDAKERLVDALYPSLFADMGDRIRLVAQSTTLFAKAYAPEPAPVASAPGSAAEDSEGDDELDQQHHRAPVPPVERRGAGSQATTTAAERARRAAALEALLDERDDRERAAPGGNKKKRKVPGLAQQGPSSVSSGGRGDRDDDRDARDSDEAPAPPSSTSINRLNTNAMAGLDAAETGLRSDFASAMVGVVKALGPSHASVISKIAPGKRAPYSARQARPAAPEADAHVRRVRRKLAANVAANAERERDAAALAAAALSAAAARSPPSKSSKREQRAAAKATKASKGPAPAPAWPEPFDPDSDIVLPNLYDPTLGPATQQLVRRRPIAGGVNDAKAQSKSSLAWTQSDGTPFPSTFTFSSPPGPFVLARLVELEAERAKVTKARALLLERAKELEAARRDVAAATGALATTTAANNAATAAKRKGKTFASRGTQTDPVSIGTALVKRTATATTVPPPATPLPPLLNNAKTANKNAKGKKKRAAHANANNHHHRDNYVPSRMPGSAAQAREQASAALDYLDGIGLVDPTSAFNPHPQLGLSPLVPAFAALDEWLCGFCETRILYGSANTLAEAIRKRKAVLKVRKKAQDRAKRAAAGQGPSGAAAGRPKPNPRVSTGVQTAA